MFKKNRRLSFRNGFSFIELMVVIAIMVLMVGLLFVSQNDNKVQRNVNDAARQIVAQLRALQNDAINGKQIENPSGSGNYSIACDFKFKADANATKYSISYTTYASLKNSCSDSGTHAAINNSTDIDLSSGKGTVAISDGASNGVDLFFSSPRGDLTTSTYSITLTSGSSSAIVCVCASGNIYEKTNAVACCS
jgi:prepilin-type N-terminal cleavage/methylation domain-containing protein